MEIYTENLVLRDFRHEDLPEYQKLRDEPKFQRFYSEEDSSKDKSAQLLQQFIDQAEANPRTKFQLAICSRQNELMGSCGIRLESAGNYSIGCELGRRWHGSGAAREAGMAIIDFGFRELHVARIYAETISENKAATRLCEALGMKLEEERGNDKLFKGQSWTTVVYSILQDEWLPSNPMT